MGTMTDDKKTEQTDGTFSGDITRRDFATFLVGAGLAVTVGPVAAAEIEVVEINVEVKTPDGTCDAAFIHPKTGSHPGVLIWPDAFGFLPLIRALRNRNTRRG